MSEIPSEPNIEEDVDLMSPKVVFLLDAGFSLQLQQHVQEIVDGHPLWTSRFLRDDTAAVIKTHRDFIKGGSMIIRTNTYQATVQGFIRHMGLTENEALELIGKAVELARTAIALENKEGKVLVAGSVGPYGASLHDGSEYTGSYADQVTVDQLIEWHRDKVSQLVKSGVDLLAFETIPCSKEAVAVIRLFKEFPNIRAWLSFSIKNENCISNGEKFVDVIDIVLKEAVSSGVSDRIVAIGMNCVNPKLVTPLLTEAKKQFPGQSFIAYPNSGEHYNTQLQRWEEVSDMVPLNDFIKEWLNLGARYIGGCCRTTDKDLPLMLASIRKWTSSRKTSH